MVGIFFFVLHANQKVVLFLPSLLSLFLGSGYLGVAYINHKKKSVVVSQRGTYTEEDFITDALFLFGKPDICFANAFSFCLHLNNILEGKEYPNIFFLTLNIEQHPFYSIIYTGHSLGAALSEVQAYRDYMPAVTFESPGSKEVIEKMSQKKKFDPKRAQKYITCYLAEPNIGEEPPFFFYFFSCTTSKYDKESRW